MKTEEVIKAKAELETLIMTQVEKLALMAGADIEIKVSVEVLTLTTSNPAKPIELYVANKCLTTKIGKM